MADNLTKDKRSWNMSRIHSTGTSLELKVRKYLFNKGFRYRINVKSLPGKPDVVMKKYNTVIFINGCFWHKHENCYRSNIPKTNSNYWIEKLSKNVERDKKNIEQLKSDGWNVIVLWECKIEKDFDNTMKQVIENILNCNHADHEQQSNL